MSDNHPDLEEEMNDLRHEIEAFKKEKERVRAIVGKVGGVPPLNTKLFNYIFIGFVMICLLVSLLHAWHGRDIQGILVELAVAAVSFKLIYLMHSQTRVNHFQLWVLSSIEWRLNEIVRDLNQSREKAGEGVRQ